MKRRAVDPVDAVTLIPTSEEDLAVVAGGADPGPWTGPSMFVSGSKEEKEYMAWKAAGGKVVDPPPPDRDSEEWRRENRRNWENGPKLQG